MLDKISKFLETKVNISFSLSSDYWTICLFVFGGSLLTFLLVRL
jgi:hypothetical protein